MEDKNTTLKTWRVFVWRPFTPPGEDTTYGGRKYATYKCVVSLHGGAKGSHANTRQMVILALTNALVVYILHIGTPNRWLLPQYITLNKR